MRLTALLKPKYIKTLHGSRIAIAIGLEQITPRLARECGFAGISDLLKVAKHGRGENVFLIDFHYIAPKSDHRQR